MRVLNIATLIQSDQQTSKESNLDTGPQFATAIWGGASWVAVNPNTA
jgi:hypothetical protein